VTSRRLGEEQPAANVGHLETADRRFGIGPLFTRGRGAKRAADRPLGQRVADLDDVVRGVVFAISIRRIAAGWVLKISARPLPANL
jgi:hypothetical protein